MEKLTKKIDTTLHYVQFIIARIIIVVVIVLLINSIIARQIDAIIFYSLFLIYGFFLLKKVFDKPTEISFDKNFIYLKNGTERIKFKDINSVRKNRILYQSDGMESKIKLPNFHFIDKNWKELKELINR